MYKFGKDIEAGDMALFYGEYVEGGIALDAWDEEGTFSETENRYQALVYYKGTGERTWRIVGYQQIVFK